MGILDAIEAGGSGLEVHAERLEINATNMANLDTPNYVRKIPILMAKEDISFNNLLNKMKDETFKSGTLPVMTGGVSMTGIIEDPSESEKVYAPGHPDADENGFIRRSNVNPLIDMADATMASRAYEASLAVVNMSKTMAMRASEIGK